MNPSWLGRMLAIADVFATSFVPVIAADVMREASTGEAYCSLAYSDFAAARMGTPASASFHSAKKSW
jgi:hypothetical protein